MNELTTRIRTAVVFAIIFLACVYASPLSYSIFFGFMIFGSSREMHRMYQLYHGKRVRRRGTLISGIIALIPFGFVLWAEYFFLHHNWEIILISGCVIMAVLLSLDIYSTREPILFRLPLFLTLFIYPTMMVSVITVSLFCDDGTYLWQMAMVVISSTWSVDIGAYFIGKNFGKRKLAPRISKNKTIEGAAGGILMAGVTGGLISYIFNTSVLVGFAIGTNCGVWGIYGDLFESKMKRAAGIKDSGSFLPGHGGFLDRFDGFVFALPVASLIIWLYLQYKI